MIAPITLPALSKAETTELARMLLARKLMPEDRRGTLSPMLNAPLAQCVALVGDIPSALKNWLPRLSQQFIDEMSDASADPSLSHHLSNLESDEARRSLVRQYFLPFQAEQEFDVSSAQGIAQSFSGVGHLSNALVEMGPLYPARPDGSSIVLPRPFASSIFDQLLIGRHSHIHLEEMRSGGTEMQSSDVVIRRFIDVVGAQSADAPSRPPFHSRQLKHSEFAQSFAYTQMMELGFSREEMMAALSAWELVEE